MKRMSSTRFHKAAKDGLIEILKEANRKDANAKDNDSMTPVLWAAFEGHLDALRLLCGRGGDPDRSDQFGNTALHLAAAKGHLYCVDFLVKFGVNIYALDIDKHSAKDLAAINNRDEILRFLDVAITNFEACNRKKAKTMKELAEKQCEKRMREFLKRQKLMEQDDLTQKQVVADRDTLRSNTSRSTTSSMLSTLKQKIWSSQGNLNKSTIGSSSKFSDSSASENSCKSLSVSFMASGTECTSMRRRRSNNEECLYNNVNINTVTQYRTDGAAYYDVTAGAGTYQKEQTQLSRPRIRRNKSCIRGTSSEESSDMYSTLTRSRSQAYLLANSSSVDGHDDGTENLRNVLKQRPLFGAGALDSLSSRRSVAAALSQLAESTSQTNSSKSSTTISKNFDYTKCSENKLSKHFGALSISEDDLAAVDLSDDDRISMQRGSLELFLMIWGLEEFLSIFIKQQIDMEILMLLTEDDLKSLSLPLGPFRKLHFAIQERKNILAKPGPLIDSEL